MSEIEMMFYRSSDDDPPFPEPGEIVWLDPGDGSPAVRCLVSISEPGNVEGQALAAGWIDPDQGGR